MKITNKNKKPTKKKPTNTLTTKHLPTKVKPVKNTKNTTDYLKCLADTWTKGKKITACCANCKKQSHSLAILREQEITKLTTAYKQVGISLTNLLKPLK